MYGLPPSTDVMRGLPKKTIIEKFCLSGKERSVFDSNIHRITIANEISSRTVNLSGDAVSGIFILRVEVNSEDYDRDSVSMLFRSIPQNMVMVVECGPRCRPVVMKDVVLEGGWRLTEDMELTIDGLDLDRVWENLIVQVGTIRIEDGNDLETQIAKDEERRKREAEIAKLEKKMASEKQPRRKKELFDRIKALRSCGYKTTAQPEYSSEPGGTHEH